MMYVFNVNPDFNIRALSYGAIDIVLYCIGAFNMRLVSIRLPI